MRNNFNIKARIEDVHDYGASFAVILLKNRKFKRKTIKTCLVLFSKDYNIINKLKEHKRNNQELVFNFYIHAFENLNMGQKFFNTKCYLLDYKLVVKD